MPKAEPQSQSQDQWPSRSQSPAHARSQVRPRPEPPALTRVSMRDLLASCAAATAISTPPSAPEPERHRPARDHREAA